MQSDHSHPASFRDRSGFIFYKDGRLYRQVNSSYREQYDQLIQSGLFQTLVDRKLLIPHSEIEIEAPGFPEAYRVIEPDLIHFISYPYEWSFSQLKDAALLTLEIQEIALEHNMALKDASAFNVQFKHGQPILIDTLSFEAYQEGEPWVAYRQFCQHFLAPLALMSFVDIRLLNLFTSYIDGIPIDLASRLLPLKTRLNPGLLTHIHLHAASQRRFTTRNTDKSQVRGSVSSTAMRGLVDSLKRTISALDWKPLGTEWADYYSSSQNYENQAAASKQALVSSILSELNPREVWDLGANTGYYSELATKLEIPTISFDIDPGAVELNYQRSKEINDKWRLPLLLDLTNPTPAIGWNNRERASLLQRGPTDFVMALALIHHLAISNNVPMAALARFFAGLGKHVLIEFVPKSDPQVQRLLAFREDIFEDYDQETFEEQFGAYFSLDRKEPIDGSERVLYLFESRNL
ncbi:MAG: hypothetical protein PVF85_08295 [Anaerolineales bacterium]|jgi:hypothetical protein